MDRETLLLMALGMLIAASFVVGVSGWVLFVRDRRLRPSAPVPDDAGHPEVPEES